MRREDPSAVRLAGPEGGSLSSIEEVVELFSGPNPPSLQDLDAVSFPDAYAIRRDMQQWKRPVFDRIYVNRSLRFDRIEYVGFDMDYTIACYTPAYQELCYRMLVEMLVNKMGYPPAVRDLPYDPRDSIRGLAIDFELGNTLKLDEHGIIMKCFHGKEVVPKHSIVEIYPSKRVSMKDMGKRFYVLNTLFSLPEACAFSNLVQHFENVTRACSADQPSPPRAGLAHHDHTLVFRNRSNCPMDLHFKNIWTDVHTCTDLLHNEVGLKEETLKNLDIYVQRTDRLRALLERLRADNKKLFLLTNSAWSYTDPMMRYLLGVTSCAWTELFDMVIVDAQKPKFFNEGNTLRQIDPRTGTLSIERTSNVFVRGQVYHGGDLKTMEEMAGITSGDTVLYVGDHIFADVRISKKRRGWRTMLIVPELEHELKTWSCPAAQKLSNRLYALQSIKAMLYRDFDAVLSPYGKPNMIRLQNAISATVEEKDALYNPYFGSLFKSGLKQSFFTQQMLRYACIYSAHYINLLNYPLFYTFTADAWFLPHEEYFVLQGRP